MIAQRCKLLRLCICMGLPSGLAAQEANLDRPTITLSNGDAARIKIGPQHAEPGDTRYPARTYVGNTGTVIEFSMTAPREGVWNRGAPPRLSDLIGNPERQAALDRTARPGGWVTPPAASR